MRLRILRPIDSDHLVLLGLLACSLSLNLYLGFRIRESSQGMHAVSFQGGFAKGDVLKSLEIKDLNGQVRTISLVGEQPTVVYFFRPSCGWCGRNMPSLVSLYSRFGSGFRFVAISLEEAGVKDFVTKHQVEFPAYSALSPNESLSSKVPGVPETILVSRDGVVVERWSGAYIGKTKEQIERYFRLVHL
jgi:peroxiredoxin